jgi:hypothetical protein
LESRNLLSNVSVNNAAEDTTSQNTQSESTAAVANDGTIIVGFNDSEEYINSSHFTGYAYSTDGGQSFTDAGGLPNSSAGDAGDPVLAVNKGNGHVYFSALALNSGNVVQFFKSTDNGHTFGSPVNAIPGISSRDVLDKDWMTVDNFSGKGTIYVSATDFGPFSTSLVVSESTNDGGRWRGQRVATGTVQGSNVVVGADHSAYVFWLDGNQASERIMMKKSNTSGLFKTSALKVATLKTTGTNGDLGLDFRTNAFPQAATNPNNSSILYVVYDDVGQAAGDRGDIYFTESTNNGGSWSTPVKLNDDTTAADQFFPTITVTPDGTHMFVTWYDRRNAATQNGNIERFGVIGSISGSTVTFGSNFGYSDAPFPEEFGADPVVVSNYMGDYDQATSDNSNFYTSFVDTRRGNQDVFFEKIPVTGLSAAAAIPRLVVHGSPATADMATDFGSGLGGRSASLVAANTAFFGDLGRFLLPGSSSTGDEIAVPTVVGVPSTPGAAAPSAAPAESLSNNFTFMHHAPGQSTQDDLGLWKPDGL